jgi:hypothetical protein
VQRTRPLRYAVRDSRRTRAAPSIRTIVTVAAVVVTAVLMLKLGIWYFAGLLGIYGALDVTQRLEARRDARVRLAIMTAVGHPARSVSFRGLARHCHHAGWIAKRLGWLACPMVRESFWRHSIQFKSVRGAAPLNMLLQALNEEKLATRIRLPAAAQSFAQRLSQQSFWEAGQSA